MCAPWLLFYDPLLFIFYQSCSLGTRWNERNSMNVLFKTRARTMKEYQFFRLSIAPSFSPCLQQYYRRGAIQCRFERIASGAVHRNRIFLREFLRQLADLFENRRLSLNFFRVIWRERKISFLRWCGFKFA